MFYQLVLSCQLVVTVTEVRLTAKVTCKSEMIYLRVRACVLGYNTDLQKINKNTTRTAEPQLLIANLRALGQCPTSGALPAR